VNTDVSWPDLDEAESRVLKIQTKLHRWASDDPSRCFKDLYNLVCDPAFLVVAWARVRGNRGARSAGVDGVKPRSIVFGSETLLVGLRAELKALAFRPLPVRQRMIPKANGKLRGLGIPTARDRVIQASLKLVLEPILEADFKPCSYGFRPRRRTQDAIAEIHFFGTHSYEWVLEADITACFDEISHTGLVDRLQKRIGDKRVLGLVKAFLKAGILSEDAVVRHPVSGTPQGEFSHHCCRTSLFLSLTNTSPRPGTRSVLLALANNVGARVWPTTAWSVMPMIGWSWWPAPEPTQNACRRRLQWCSPRWVCACRKRRRGSSTSTRASISWAFGYSASRSEARRS